MSTITVSVTWEVLTCGQCGLQFAVPQHWVNSRREDHAEWRCPNGHTRHFPAESEREKLAREKRDIELKLQAQLNEANHARLVAERERDKAVKEKRKVERRIAHGVCPCCNQTFNDIANHMVTSHPEFRLPEGKKPKLIKAAS